MTDKDHADAIRAAATALNDAIAAARKAKVFAIIDTIEVQLMGDVKPTHQVVASVVKAI